jgi:hypothetical protein
MAVAPSIVEDEDAVAGTTAGLSGTTSPGVSVADQVNAKEMG